MLSMANVSVHVHAVNTSNNSKTSNNQIVSVLSNYTKTL